MTSPQFDEIIHAPIRLSVVSMLAPAEGVEFRFLRDKLGVADSVLSKHVSTLESAGYVTVRKENLGRGRRRTWIGLTDTGLAAFRAHVAALDEIVAQARDTIARD
jgi:DNA-binding MarR family transcriptional regulator